jgi:hypothetical protein
MKVVLSFTVLTGAQRFFAPAPALRHREPAFQPAFVQADRSIAPPSWHSQAEPVLSPAFMQSDPGMPPAWEGQAEHGSAQQDMTAFAAALVVAAVAVRFAVAAVSGEAKAMPEGSKKFAFLDWREDGFVLEGPAELGECVRAALEDKAGPLKVDSRQSDELRVVYRKSFDTKAPPASYFHPHFTEMLELLDILGFSIETTVPVRESAHSPYTQRYIFSTRCVPNVNDFLPTPEKERVPDVDEFLPAPSKELPSSLALQSRRHEPEPLDKATTIPVLGAEDSPYEHSPYMRRYISSKKRVPSVDGFSAIQQEHPLGAQIIAPEP